MWSEGEPDKISVFTRTADVEGELLRTNVSTVLEEYRQYLSPRLLLFLHNPTGIIEADVGPSSLKEVLRETREGQELLELLVVACTDWDEPLRLSPPSDAMSLREVERRAEMEQECDGKRWVAEEAEDEEPLDRIVREESPQREVFGVGPDEEACYVIRLLDEELQPWLYVGKSSSVFQRLAKHVSDGGSFAEAKRRRMEVVEIEEVRTDVGEAELYEEVCEEHEVPRGRVCGGQ